MSRGPKGFSEEEKGELRARLREECERSWAEHGYKKTGVGELTSKIGISTGAFYLLYESKEDLFCETLMQVQDKLKKGIRKIIEEEKGKAGFIKAMQWHFREYERAPFLYDMGTPDFLAFLNRLPKERVEGLKFDSVSFFKETLRQGGLTLKIDAEKAYAVISTLLYTVTLKERMPYDQFTVFSFLLESAMNQIFE